MNPATTTPFAQMPLKMATAHIRGRIKQAGIKARCKGIVSCGSEVIVISSMHPTEVAFTEDEQRVLRRLAKVNGLTWVRGMEIDVERMTDPHEMRCYR